VRLPGPRGSLAARVLVPPSKSLTNRALVGCAVAGGGVIRAPLDCDDTRVLASALSAAGWPIDWGDELRVGERTPVEERVPLWLGDSGTGAAIWRCSHRPGRFVVDGGRRLRERPMNRCSTHCPRWVRAVADAACGRDDGAARRWQVGALSSHLSSQLALSLRR
jgi:5-enolpyruvylshikimate-3-phosphate synthase